MTHTPGPTRNGGYDVTTPIRETFHDRDRDIEYHTVRPVAEACCDGDDLRPSGVEGVIGLDVLRAMTCKPDDELREALADTRRTNALDSRDVAGMVHEIDH